MFIFIFLICISTLFAFYMMYRNEWVFRRRIELIDLCYKMNAENELSWYNGYKFDEICNTYDHDICRFWIWSYKELIRDKKRYEALMEYKQRIGGMK